MAAAARALVPEGRDGLALGAARALCSFCFGLGTVAGKRGGSKRCDCVHRAVARAVLGRLATVRMRQAYGFTHVHATPAGTWGRQDEEWLADVALAARCALTEWERELFELHFVCGRPWFLCLDALGVNRGNFFHGVYRVEKKLGRAFGERGLYPWRRYYKPSTQLMSLGMRRR